MAVRSIGLAANARSAGCNATAARLVPFCLACTASTRPRSRWVLYQARAKLANCFASNDVSVKALKPGRVASPSYDRVRQVTLTRCGW